MTSLPPRVPGPPRRPDQPPPVCRRPERNPYFQGRDDILYMISKKLADGPVLLCDDPEVPQAGKTQAAVEYAHRFALRYDVVWWLECAGDADLAAQFDEMTAELHQARTSHGWGSSERRLLVFDGVERMAKIAATIENCPGHRLITAHDGDHWRAGTAVPLGRLSRYESAMLVTTMAPMVDPSLAEEFAEILDYRPAQLAEVSGYMLRDEISPELCMRLLKMPAETRPPAAAALPPLVPEQTPRHLRPHVLQDGQLSKAALAQLVEALKQVEPIGEEATFRAWIRRIETRHGDLGLAHSVYVATRLVYLIERCARHPTPELFQTMIDELAVFAVNDPALPPLRDLVARYIESRYGRDHLG